MPTMPTLSPATTVVPTPKNTRKKVPTISARYFFMIPLMDLLRSPRPRRGGVARRCSSRQLRGESQEGKVGDAAGQIERSQQVIALRPRSLAEAAPYSQEKVAAS